ncbi:MAG: TolC family protein [Phycisphaeraceae bacterium]|nr:TolC family protein [Phycisphaeraceae bacterium]
MKRITCTIMLLLLAMLSPGCAVDQDQEIAAYRDLLDGPQTTPQAPTYDPQQPLDLLTALRLANYHNESLAIAGEDYLQALIAKDRAAAAFLPTVNLTPTYSLRDKTAMGAGNPFVNKISPTHTLDVPLEAELDLNPIQDAAAVGAADAYSRAAAAQLLDAQQQVLLDVAKTFYHILASEQRVDVLTRSQALQQQRVLDSRTMAEAGIGRKLDVSQNEAQVARTSVQLIDARNAVQRGRTVLATLIGETRVDGPLSDTFDAPVDEPDFEQLIDIAYAERDDLSAAASRIESASAALKAAWAGYFPSVSLDLTYFLDRESFPTDVDWLSVVKLHVPLFSAGLVHADVRSAFSRLRQAKLTETLIARQVRQQVAIAWDDWSSARRRVDQLLVQERAAAEAFGQAEAMFSAGLTTNLERLIALDDMLAARLELATARDDSTIRCLELIRAVGRLKLDRIAQPVDLMFAPPGLDDESTN